MLEADYVIVGAGSAGCVLANRLSADPRIRVLLIEAGGDDRPLKNWKQFGTNLMIHVPVGFTEAINDPRIRWDLQTEAESDAGGRTMPVIRAKVLGGCSSINAMLYVRGERTDYDDWERLGCTGWNWGDVLPYFCRGENQERGEDAWHGVGGPLNVADSQGLFPVSEAVLAAAAASGIPTLRDINTGQQFGAAQAQVTQRKGWRHSAAVAYLHPAMSRPNLRVLTEAQATRVLVESGRATGVAFQREGNRQIAHAKAEVIIAGGTFGSPQLLELSGIGQAQRLTDLGIPIVSNSPSVGENLQDHYMSYVAFELRADVRSINGLTRGLPMAGQALKYLFTRKGLLAESAAQLLIYGKSDPSLEIPDIQFSVTPASIKDHMKPKMQGRMETNFEPGLTFGPCHLQPASRGWVHIRSADPLDRPEIQFNYLSNPLDQAVQIAGVRMARQIAAQAPLSELVVRELTPGSAEQTDDEILDFVRKHGDSVYHPVGTVRMGADADAPLDPRLRVRGVEGLRVVDASIMPRLISGNTNAPTIMIAEKASDMILADGRASGPLSI